MWVCARRLDAWWHSTHSCCRPKPQHTPSTPLIHTHVSAQTHLHKLLLALQEAVKVGPRLQPPALPVGGGPHRGAELQLPPASWALSTRLSCHRQLVCSLPQGGAHQGGWWCGAGARDGRRAAGEGRGRRVGVLGAREGLGLGRGSQQLGPLLLQAGNEAGRQSGAARPTDRACCGTQAQRRGPWSAHARCPACNPLRSAPSALAPTCSHIAAAWRCRPCRSTAWAYRRALALSGRPAMAGLSSAAAVLEAVLSWRRAGEVAACCSTAGMAAPDRSPWCACLGWTGSGSACRGWPGGTMPPPSAGSASAGTRPWLASTAAAAAAFSPALCSSSSCRCTA